ncbi:MAG: VOC family protein [Paucibacter sp.]|nr:VOC family protein [Roseateles sp.]
MKLGYTILYVADVAQSLAFYEGAFGLSRRFLHESGAYGELDTGATVVGFAALELANANFEGGVQPLDAQARPPAFELGFVTEDVGAAHAKALAAGAVELQPPTAKPWGQTVSYLRCPDGSLVEICTPMG